MLSYLARRIISAILVLFIIAGISFVVIQLPPGDFGDIYKQRLINLGGLSPQEAEASADKLRERYGLNDPVPVQFLNWIGGILTRGEFGYSFAYSRDVGELVAERLPRTFLLALASHAISSLVGITLGIYIARRQYSLADNLASTLAFIATSVPRFSLALIIIFWLAFGLGQEHVQSLFSPEYVFAPWSLAKVRDLLQHVWPVIFIAGFGGVARNMRVMRGNLLDVLNAQYVTTARSKGLRERTVINRHAVPNALHPILAYQGAVLPYMINGELEASIVLSIPTLGPLFLQSLSNQDIYISGTMLLVYGALLIIGNLLADLALGLLDPRIRFS